MESGQDACSFQAQRGGRGSALQSEVKVNGRSYEEAKRVYDRIRGEKTGKGYQITQASANANEAIAVGLPATKEHSGHTPELLTPIEEPEAVLLAQDASWWFQQKRDRTRLAVQKSEGKYSGINKLGQIIPIDSRLAESLDRVKARGCLADGEITDLRFYIWHLLSVNNTDLRVQPYEIRYVNLTQHFRGVSDVLRVCETAMTTKAKRDFVKKMHSANAEGFVCKNCNSVYAGGRAGQHFKCKFVVTASFIVGPKPEKKANDGHRSVAVYLLDDTRQRFMGTVGVPDRYRLPKEGEIVEVQYLYCHPGPDGKLIQAKYFGKVRDDIEIAECSVSQLKVKPNDSDSIES